MPIATLRSYERITVPREIRAGLRLEPGDQLHFTLLLHGTVVTRAKKRRLAALAGSLCTTQRRPVSHVRMTRVVAEAAADRARALSARAPRSRRR
jgi:bifunctional DNA-binding transcriptional regulator/antitoxin component of YhaV-PrlF toxin-antitoxin module